MKLSSLLLVGLVASVAGVPGAGKAAEASGPAVAPVAKAGAPAFPEFGSAVPALKPAFEIRGKTPVLNDGALHLVAMFSTRITASLKAIPYLNDFHKRFATRGVRVTGVSVWEESDSAVKDFVATRGDTLAFSVMFDGRDAGGTVTTLWQDGPSLRTVPYLFVVKNGTLLWHGTPDELGAETVEAMLAGRYDHAAEAARRKAIEDARAKAAPIAEAIEDLLGAQKNTEALAKCDEFERVLPECDKRLVAQMRAECYFALGDFKKGFAQVALFVAAYPNDAETQAMAALSIVSEPRFLERDFELAKRCVNRALEITPVEPYRLLKARVYYTAGEVAEAERLLATIAEPKNKLVAEHMKLIREAVKKREPWPIPPAQDCACGAH